MRKKSSSIAMAGMLAALAVVILYLGSMIELLDLSASVLGALAVMVAIVELGQGYAWGVYLVAAVLSVLLFPRTASVVFAAFVGYYPIVKVYLDRIRVKVVQYFCKLVLFNLFLFGMLWLCQVFLGTENEWIALGKMLILLGNLCFVVYDFALSRLAIFYLVKIKSKMKKH